MTIVFRKPSKSERKAGTVFRLDSCVSSKHCGLFEIKCLQIGGCAAFENINCVPESIKKANKIANAWREDQPRDRLKVDIIALDCRAKRTRQISLKKGRAFDELIQRFENQIPFLVSFLLLSYFFNPPEVALEFGKVNEQIRPFFLTNEKFSSLSQ